MFYTFTGILGVDSHVEEHKSHLPLFFLYYLLGHMDIVYQF